MPFAQWHAPFESEERFDERFPADFICEALDQTRGWFYSLLAVSTLLFDRSSYKTVVCLGLLVDPEGKKMSKSLGNVVVPWEVIDRYGADAFRWYFFTAKSPWDGYRFSVDTVGEQVRLFLKQLWNTYRYLTIYAVERESEPTDLDRWAQSRTAATVEFVTERMEAFDATAAGRAIGELVDDLSNWYLRRSRRRFWEGDSAAFETLRSCLLTVAKLLAPFCPFVSDEIYDNLDGELESVHLCDWPEPGERDVALEAAMATAREAVRLGLAARGQAKVKLRQPLREAVVVAAGRERDAIEGLSDLVRDELNVKELRFVSQADELGSYEVRPNYRTLGPRFGSAMPQAAAAIAVLDPGAVAGVVAGGGTVGVSVEGSEHQLGPDDLELRLQPLAGYQLEREGGHAVALELAIDEELRREGLAREVVRAVQLARQSAGLDVSDRIALALAGDQDLLEAARAHEEYVAGETLATSVAYDGEGPASEAGAETASIEGRELRIFVTKS
jgi:isoleucyl-tRNA synthetase